MISKPEAIDSKPEYADYRDEGCGLFPACLTCPLPRCRYDDQLEGRRPAKELRDQQVLAQRNQQGKSVSELAERFGVSKRTIQRIIRRSRNGHLSTATCDEQTYSSSADSADGPGPAQGLSR